MKKIITTIVTAGMLLTMASCAASVDETKETEMPDRETIETVIDEPEENNMQIPNPWSDFDTLEEAVASSGVDFRVPDEYKSNVTAYRAIPGDIIEVLLVIDGKDVTVRACNSTEADISGDYNDYQVVMQNRCRDLEVTYKSNDQDLANLITWADETCSYCIVSTAGIPSDTAVEIVSSFILENTGAY